VQELKDRTGGGADVEIAGLPLAEVAGHVPQLVRGIVEGSDRIRDIVEELKEFGRRDDLDFEPLAVNDVVGSAVFLMDKAIRTHTRKFSVVSGDGLPLVRGRRRRLEQVVVNLIQNACDALRHDEEAIEVETFADEPTGTVRITVRDQGAGIRAEDLPRVTDPFFTTRRSAGGTGLGLSISLGIVKEHGGRLFFESTLDRGTTAVVVLPASRAD
jgi:polar amino acid transport system substrate-binding protein